jgi:hypothetical protein
MNSEQHTNSMYICACIDLWITAEAHARSFFLARNSKIKNKKTFGAVLILGADGDDKHKYFFICPYSNYVNH